MELEALRAQLSDPDAAVREAAARQLAARLPDSSAALGNARPRFERRLGAAMLEGWHVKESVTLLAPDEGANVIFSSEPVAGGLDTAAYAQIQRQLLREEFPGFRERLFGAAPVFGGRDGYRGIYDWTPPDGAPVTQIQLYCIEAGRGYTATATVPTASYEARRAELIGVLSDLDLDAAVQSPHGAGAEAHAGRLGNLIGGLALLAVAAAAALVLFLLVVTVTDAL